MCVRAAMATFAKVPRFFLKPSHTEVDAVRGLAPSGPLPFPAAPPTGLHAQLQSLFCGGASVGATFRSPLWRHPRAPFLSVVRSLWRAHGWIEPELAQCVAACATSMKTALGSVCVPHGGRTARVPPHCAFSVALGGWRACSGRALGAQPPAGENA